MDDSKAQGPLLMMLSIHDLDVPCLPRICLNFQLQKTILNREWHTGSVN
jgi:hypothetical protein